MNVIQSIVQAITNKTEAPVSEPLSAETSAQIYRASAGRGAPVEVRVDSMERPTLKNDLQVKRDASPKVTFEQQCRFVSSTLPQPSKSELVSLRDLQAKCDKTWADIGRTFCRDSAQRDFAAFDREQWNKIYESGKDLAECKVVTREDFFRDYENKQQAAKRLHEHLRESGRDLCKPIITKFADAAKAELHRLETAERSEASALGFEYQPSPRTQVLRLLVGRLSNFTKSPNPGTPRQLLPWLEI